MNFDHSLLVRLLNKNTNQFDNRILNYGHIAFPRCFHLPVLNLSNYFLFTLSIIKLLRINILLKRGHFPIFKFPKMCCLRIY